MKKLKEKRAALIKEAGDILKGDVTPELEERVNAIHQEVERINVLLDAEERQAAFEAVAAEHRVEKTSGDLKDAIEEFRSILKVEKRDISYSENVFAPKGFVAELIKSLDERLFIRETARRFTLTQQEGITIPRRTVRMGAATWGNSPAADTDLALGSVILKPAPLNGLVKIDKRVVKVSALPIERVISDEMVDRFANALESAYLTGAGANDTPFGIFNTTAVPVARDVTQGSGITAEGFIAAKNKLASGYNPVWVIHPDVLTSIESLKDGNGQYIFMHSFRAGEPDTILGIPVMKSAHAPSATTTGSYIAALGDFGRGYAIADVEAMEMQVLSELYAATNQIGYKGYLLTTGNVIDPEAFVRVKVGA